jgi:hypothetical protein
MTPEELVDELKKQGLEDKKPWVMQEISEYVKTDGQPSSSPSSVTVDMSDKPIHRLGNSRYYLIGDVEEEEEEEST